jgi:type I restriction enzyme S subunit
MLQAQRSALSPASWDRRRLKFHLAAFFGGGTPSKENEAFWTEGTIPWVSPKDMKARRISDAEDRITLEAVQQSATNMVPPGSVLMVVRSGILKHSLPVAINTVPVALNQDLKAFRFRHSLDARFFLFWIEGQAKNLLLEWGQIGATVDNIDIEAMLNAEIPLPDLPTQQQIADFLDRETARIDLLIEKKQRLSELYDQRQFSEVSRLLVVGVRSDVRRRSSEYEWMADIPAHWRWVRMKDVCIEVVDCKNRTPPEVDDGAYLVARTTCIKNGQFVRDGGYATDQASFLE